VELLFVVVLIVVLVLLSTPLFSRTLQTLEKRACADNILSLLELARSKAILEQVPYGIQFDLDKRLYWLVRGEPGKPAHEAARIKETWGRTRAIPSAVALVSEDPSVFFHLDGSATPFSLEMISNNGPSFTFHVDPSVGKSTFFEKPF
jgi:hypothetical protein